MAVDKLKNQIRVQLAQVDHPLVGDRHYSENEIDELYIEIVKTGALIVDPPKFYPQHGKHYYALFFKDLDGIKLELVYEKN